ncbi:MAG TPA: FliM/FliN family flagellar motor switch protein [Solirubrobacteraceae bacterium]|jgi:flagellar motor switch protein FliM|nr:FliM/FliN family flagellar motor switch protein [Solirubrobacteraceae bacterium]
MSQTSGESRAPEADLDHAEGIAGDEQAVGVRKLDFSQPTKFTTDLRRRVERALDQCCEALATRLSGELKAVVELRLADSTQLTWAAAKAQLPADSVALAVEAESIGTRMLLSVELPFMLQALECLLGGDPAQAPAERRLSEIDWMLAKRLSDLMVNQMSLAWHELAGVGLRAGEPDMEADAGVLAPVGEPTLSLGLEGRIEDLQSSISLLIPWTAIEPLAARIRGARGRPQRADPHEADAVRRGLAGAQVTLRAEVGSVEMPIERMLGLTPGMLLELEERVEDGVRLCAEGVPLGRGRPGSSGARRAIKLESVSAPAPRAGKYAKLGRSELDRARAHMGGAQKSPETRGILNSVFVRVWVELGRAHIPFGGVLELLPGAVVELDQGVEAPVDLLVNGLCFAHGGLVVTGDGGWGVRVDELA